MNAQDFNTLSQWLRKRCGVTYAAEKAWWLEARLHPLLQAHGLSVPQLIQALYGMNNTLADQVVAAVMIHETSFMRDARIFDTIKNDVMPAFKKKFPERTMRIWCAGCASGQEPYSLSMLATEQKIDIAITATDISRSVLDLARQGVYSQFDVQRGLPTPLLLKYFTQHGLDWQINDAIRRNVQFDTANLVEAFSTLGTFDLIFCRNVLFYFVTDMRRDILHRLRKNAHADTLLVLGSAETLLGLQDHWTPVTGQHGFYTPVPFNS